MGGAFENVAVAALRRASVGRTGYPLHSAQKAPPAGNRGMIGTREVAKPTCIGARVSRVRLFGGITDSDLGQGIRIRAGSVRPPKLLIFEASGARGLGSLRAMTRVGPKSDAPRKCLSKAITHVLKFIPPASAN
jgi:hypothetical protein